MVELVVVGASSGGLEVLITLLQNLPPEYVIPTVAVLHQRANRASGVPAMLANYTHLSVVEPDDKQKIESGYFYIAPPNYHLLVERERIFSLSLDAPVQFCRPSIDVLFETAAEAYGSNLVGCVLTGANSDGALGAKSIKKRGGKILVQNPEQASVPTMPLAAMQTAKVDAVLNIESMAGVLQGYRYQGAA